MIFKILKQFTHNNMQKKHQTTHPQRGRFPKKIVIFFWVAILFLNGLQRANAQCPTGILGGPSVNSNGYICDPGSYTFTGGNANSTWTEINAVTNTQIQQVTGASITVNWSGQSGQRQIKLEDYNSPCSSYYEIIYTIQTPSLNLYSSGVGYTIIEFLPAGSNVQSWSSSDPGITNWNDLGADHNVFYNACQSGVYSVNGTSNGGCYVAGSFPVTGVDVGITGPSSVGIGSNITLTGTQNGITSSSWSSSNPSVATVNSSGVVTGISAGNTTITYEVTYTYNVPHPTAPHQIKTVVCSATKVIDVVASCSAVADAGSDANLNCSTSSATIGTSGVSGYNYSWSPSTGLSSSTVAMPTASPSSTTTYTLTVTDSADPLCSATDMVTVNVDNAPPTANAGTGGTIGCGGSGISIGVSTGASNTYSWSPSTGLSNASSATTTATPSSTTTYTLTVTGTNGCTATDVVTVTVDNTPPTADAGTGGTIGCGASGISIGVSTGGSNNYSWSPSAGLINASSVPTTATPSSTTTYTLTVTGPNGCAATDVVTVTVDNTPPTADAGTNGNIDCNNSSVSIGISTGASNDYSWSPTSGLSNPLSATTTASPSSTTTYTLTVTGANGCTATDEVTVNVDNTPPTANAGSGGTINCNNTSVTIGVSTGGSNNYSWSPSTGLSNASTVPTTATPSITTTYTLTVVGPNGCSSNDMVTVTVDNTPPAADAGNGGTIGCGASGISIGVSTGGANSYSWSPSTGLSNSSSVPTTATPSSTTTYTLTVTGANGCSATDMVTVSVDNTPPTADAGSNGAINCNISSVSIGVSTGASNSYSWSPTNGLSNPLSATTTASPSSTTTYTLTVIGANGCTATDVVTVTVDNTPPTADAGNNGTINCNISSVSIGVSTGGSNTYSWLPNTGLSNASSVPTTATPSSTTTYTLTVTGTNGCSATDLVTVTVDNTPPTADAGNGGTIGCGASGISIGVSTGGTNTYSWSPSTGLSNASTVPTIATPSTTTTYTLTVTGANGCVATDMVTVIVDNTPPTANAGSNGTINCSVSSVSIGVSTGGTNTYTWLPSSGLSNASSVPTTATPSATTTYTLTVTGTNGCTATDVVTISVDNTPPTADAGSPVTLNCTTPSSMIGTTGQSGISYSWSPTTGLNNANIAQPTASPSTTVTYTVTASASNGCTATDVVTVTVNGNFGSIGNYVWYDINHNGLRDEAAAYGINGVNVELWNATTNALVSSTTTGNNGSGQPGYYSFSTCVSGNYFVKFPLVNGGKDLTIQTPTAAIDDNSDANNANGQSPVFSIDVNGAGIAKDNLTIDAGYYQNKAMLGNYVWNDIDKNGVQNANEVGVAGITVTLYTASNTVLASTVTDAYGYYIFNPVSPGTVKVGFTLPANYMFTGSNLTTDENDSDVDPNTGMTSTYVIVGGDSNMTIDAGIYFEQPVTATVGNYVWLDVNHDGIQDNNEDGVSGVTVTLCDNAGNPVSTRITNANGFYLFTDVTPGTYSVRFSAPVGFSLSPNNGAVSVPSNSDANPSNGKTGTFVVNAGDEITYVDAGLYALPLNIGSLGNRVWYDQDHDGIQDVTESGVEGIQVTLFQQDGITVISQTATDAFGYYLFNSLPQGYYKVGFVNIPAGFELTTNTATDSVLNSDANPLTGLTPVISLGQGQNNMTYDAGIFSSVPTNTNSIGDRVWDDIDKDGIQDAGEQGISGVTVTLYDNSNVEIKNTTTDNAGFYLFPGLPNGTYYVGFSNLPVGYVFSPADQPDGTVNSDANTSSGMTPTRTLTGNTHVTDLDAGINFGNIRVGLGTLGDLVWYDMNNNGIQDVNESGVQGVAVTLYEADGSTAVNTTTTDALGNYIFTGLSADNYVVGFDNLPSGFTISPKNADSEGLNGELNSDVNSSTQKTDIIALGDGEDKMSVDMGITPPSNTASLGNYVWIDLNTNGLQDANEPGVQGMGVTLYDNANNEIATTTTDVNGEYYFVGLTPGIYYVGFNNLPQGYNFTTANSDNLGINGANNSDANPISGHTNTVNLLAGTTNPNLDAGIVSTTVASVGDYVWYDVNQDGLQGSSEVGIGGILVTLYSNSNTPLASTITRPGGGYIFTNLLAGTYHMGFSNIPSGMEFTQQVGIDGDNNNSNAIQSTGMTASFTLLSGTHNPTIDAGLTTPIDAGLGNFVWYDVDKDGIQDANEPGIPGAIVTLYNQAGTVIGTAVTDGNGAYGFTNLTAGQYRICVGNVLQIFNKDGHPMIAVATSSNAGGDDALDSDIDQAGSCTINYSLAAGEFNPTLDAGYTYQFVTPVILTSFDVYSDKCNAILNWTTSSEKNLSHFVVMQKDPGSISFQPVSQITANGNSSSILTYQHTTKVSQFGNYEYQLEMVDKDGQQVSSDVKSVNVNCLESTTGVEWYPNPVTAQLNLKFITDTDDDYQITVRDMTGRIALTTLTEIRSRHQGVTLNMSNLAAGIYSVEIVGLNYQKAFKIQIAK